MARSPSGSPSAAQTAVGFLDRFQVPLYFAAAALGAALGLSFEAPAAIAGRLVEPALVALLFATFLGVPSTRLGRAARDWRFLSVVALVNFVLAPAVAWLVTRPIAGDEALVTGALIVLLSPCVDYVIVFSGLAGGDRERLLAVTPAVMLLQIVLVPAYLWLLAGGDVAAAIEPEPFVRAFLLFIAAPLAAAAGVQALEGRHRAARAIHRGFEAAMVPLMMLVLGSVVCWQAADVAGQAGRLAPAAGGYAAFAVLMAPIGWLVGRALGLGEPARRAVGFAGVTRNSLVVLPLALALPAGFEVAPFAVVTQTMVELLVMVALVWLGRRVPARTAAGPGVRRARA
ncbi:arsenic resistance protein [Corynebacterium otitidis]|nr:bile acid:sodium symporter [Corynebacterium otitidis]EJZ82408.1 hypothetical protein HMPREF9719_00633 [Corynebacterium otitidis ATCC 51513]